MHRKKIIIGAVLVLLIALLSYIYVFIAPSNSRNWETGFEKSPEINYSKQMILISNIRDWDYDSNGPISFDYINDSFDPSEITKTYFLLEPFSKWDGIAHTFLIFEFKDNKTVAVSIEARREKGEKYNAGLGLLNQFELMYIWGTERDLVGQRLKVEEATIYKYPMTISEEYSRNLFLQLVEETDRINRNPEFYNTFTDNCTNRIAYAANQIKPGVIPFDISWFMPGYSDKLLDRIGFIEKGASVHETRSKYKIIEVLD